MLTGCVAVSTKCEGRFQRDSLGGASGRLCLDRRYFASLVMLVMKFFTSCISLAQLLCAMFA